MGWARDLFGPTLELPPKPSRATQAATAGAESATAPSSSSSPQTAPTEQLLAGKKYVVLFFSANWCPFCKRHCPDYLQAYAASLARQDLEVVFISFCEDIDAFRDFFRDMPWPAIPYEKGHIRERLRDRYAVNARAATGDHVVWRGWIRHQRRRARRSFGK